MSASKAVSKKTASAGKGKPSSEDIRRLAGPVADHTVISILETGATLTDVEVAVIHARGEGEYDVTGHTLSGTAALVAGILSKDDLYAPNEER